MKQLLDSMEQFKQVTTWLVETQDSDYLNSLSYEELKKQMNEALSFLANAYATVDRMDKDAVMEVLSLLNKATTIIKQYKDELLYHEMWWFLFLLDHRFPKQFVPSIHSSCLLEDIWSVLCFHHHYLSALPFNKQHEGISQWDYCCDRGTGKRG